MNLTSMTAVVVGASRGLGRGIATAVDDAGGSVVAVARDGAALADLARDRTVQPVVLDAGDATAAITVLDRYEPDAVILVAGATPHMLALHRQTWGRFPRIGSPTSGSRSSGCARYCFGRCEPVAVSS